MAFEMERVHRTGGLRMYSVGRLPTARHQLFVREQTSNSEWQFGLCSFTAHFLSRNCLTLDGNVGENNEQISQSTFSNGS